jgi:hypothetical protein
MHGIPIFLLANPCGKFVFLGRQKAIPQSYKMVCNAKLKKYYFNYHLQ